MSRRQFLITGLAVGGGLAIGYAVMRLDDGDAAEKFAASTPDNIALNAWIKIAPGGEITFAVHRSEMGQGVATSLPMILAEEMDADWSRVRFEFAPIDRDYFNFGMVNRGRPFGETEDSLFASAATSALRRVFKTMGLSMTISSTSIIDAYDTLRPVGAAARAMLIKAAAEKWGVGKELLRTENGWVIDKQNGRKAHYGELAESAARQRPPSNPPLKDPKRYRLVGTNVPRLDIPSKVDGSAQYGIDVTLPHMLYAAVKHCPVLGGKIERYDQKDVPDRPGVEKVVRIADNAVAVVAQSAWQAMEAVEDIGLMVSPMRDPVDTATLSEAYRKALDDPDPAVFRNDGDPGSVLAAAKTGVEAVYEVPFLAHLCMEPMNCTVCVSASKVEVWVPTQAQSLAHKVAAETAGVKPERVTLHSTLVGGGFGRRVENDFVKEALTIAKTIPGRPVKLIWSREEDIRHDAFRPAAVSRLRGGLDDKGDLVALTNTLVTQSVVASYYLRTPTARGGNARKDKSVSAGVYNIIYPVPNIRVAYVPWTSAVPAGYWRSTGSSYNCFFVESFIDELAHAARKDPLDFRRGLLRNRPRHLAVLNAAAARASWGKPLGPGYGRGIAIGESHDTVVAQVVEVRVKGEGKLSVERVVCAVDCRTVIHPDTVTAQMQGGILYGLSAALFGRVSITQGRVDQQNFDDYRMLSLPQTPKIEVHLLPRDGRPGGVGETGVPPVAPALANALFNAVGKRIRTLPISMHDFIIV